MAFSLSCCMMRIVVFVPDTRPAVCTCSSQRNGMVFCLEYSNATRFLYTRVGLQSDASRTFLRLFYVLRAFLKFGTLKP